MKRPVKLIRTGVCPTLAEVYLIDVLQNIKAAEVKKILEGSWYWSARASATVQFMDPRVGGGNGFNPVTFFCTLCERCQIIKDGSYEKCYHIFNRFIHFIRLSGRI